MGRGFFLSAKIALSIISRASSFLYVFFNNPKEEEKLENHRTLSTLENTEFNINLHMAQPSRHAKPSQDKTLSQKNVDLFGKPFGSDAQKTRFSLVEDRPSQAHARTCNA
jgi:hypothetical protein